jgi:hypothetical protein
MRFQIKFCTDFSCIRNTSLPLNFFTSKTVSRTLGNIKRILSKFIQFLIKIYVSLPHTLNVLFYVRTRITCRIGTRCNKILPEILILGYFIQQKIRFWGLSENIWTWCTFSVRILTDRHYVIFVIHHWNSLTLTLATSSETNCFPG